MPTLTRQVSQSSDDGGQNAAGVMSLTTTQAIGAGTWMAHRFQDITLPNNARITSAVLSFNLASATFNDADFDLHCQAIANAPTLTTATNNISDRTLTTDFVNWVEANIPTGLRETPDISDPIREVINSPSWAYGNSLMVIWKGLSGANLSIRSFDFSPALAATLTIEYEIDSAPPISSPLSFYLLVEQLPTVFTGKVDGTLTDPYMTIQGDQGVTGSFGAPLPGMTVFFDGDDQKAARLRSWTPGTTGTFTISVGENDDVTPFVVNNDDIEIVAQFRLWPIYPRAVIVGNSAILYMDYDIAYSDQLQLWRPVAVAGPPAVVEWNGATAQAKFVGDRSFALAPSAFVTAWLWTAPGSNEGTSTSQGTEASPVTFTYTAPGQYLVYLRVTDTNGKQHTNYTWVFVVDPNNPTTVAYTDFDVFNDNFDFEQGGGAAGFMVHGGATVSDFPNDSLVIMASRPTTPAQTTPTGYWPFRDNVHFVGYVIGDSVKQSPIEGDTSFQAATIDALMKNLSAFPISLTDYPQPLDWTQAYALITDRAASVVWHYQSTLSLMAPIQHSQYQPLIWRQDFGPGDIYSQLNNELMASLWGRVVVNHQGVVYHLIDYNLMNDSERAGITTRKRLHKGFWLDDVTIEERMVYGQPVNTVKMSGVYYPGNGVANVCPSFSEAPGNAPKVYGKELNYDRLIIASQADLNIRCGRGLAKATPKYAGFAMRFVNDGSFTIAPQELFPSRIEAGDNNRGLSITTNLIPRRISRRYDHALGLIDYGISFEPETDGPPGVTVDLPCGPPDQDRNNDDPPDVPEAGVPSEGLALADESSSFYWATAPGQAWERRVKGLTSLNFQDMIPDPWTYFKNGLSIDNIILWGCGPNFLARTTDSGKNWGMYTPYLDAPPNSWGDSAAPSFTGTMVKQIVGDYFRQDVFYALLQVVDSGNYRGWLYHTLDDGFNWTTYALTGTSQTLPLRMSLDLEDSSTLYLTTWEGDSTLKLRKYGVTGTELTLSDTIILATGTSSQDVLDRVAVAYPLTPIGDKDLVYIYGRLDISDTIAVMKSTDGGQNFNAVVSDWGEESCGALVVGPADGGGVRNHWGVRQSGTGGNPFETFERGTSIQVEDNDSFGGVSVKLDDDRVAILYNDGIDSEIAGKVANISTGAIVLGSSNQLDGTNHVVAAARLEDNKFIIGYRDDANSDRPMLRAVSASGNSLTEGTATEVDDIAADSGRYIVISSGATAGLMCYVNIVGINTEAWMNKFTVSGLSVGVGTPVEHSESADGIFFIAGVGLTGNTVMILYRGSGDDLKAQIIEFSVGVNEGTAEIVENGSGSITFDTSSLQSMVKLEDGKVAIVTVTDNLGAITIKARIIEYSGTTITTIGLPLTISTAGSTGSASIEKISSTRILIVYKNNGGLLRAETFSISGTTITSEGNAGSAGGSAPADFGPYVTRVNTSYMIVSWQESDSDIAADFLHSTSGGITQFYYGVGGLQFKSDLPLNGVNPGALAIAPTSNLAVVGTDDPAGRSVVYQAYPFEGTWNDMSGVVPTGTAVTSIKFI